MQRVNVTKTFLPPYKEYEEYVKEIWACDQLTNQGPLLQTFEAEVSKLLDVSNLHFVSNGTVALQLAIRALGITEGQIITTPFTYVATVSSILWERCEPVFVDIDPQTLCIDADKIEAAITSETKAIMPVHVFGIPCDVEKIETIAKKYNLKVIYDGAHAFGVDYKGKSLLSRGDVSTCSFHATKLFHTVEGGCVIARDASVSAEVELMKHFGHVGDDHYTLGINAKASELHAAMGLCNLKYLEANIEERKRLTKLYESLLGDKFERPVIPVEVTYNYSYLPVIFKSEAELVEKTKTLNEQGIYPRRYFYPSLNTLSYVKNKQACPISEDIASRVLCLPLYIGLDDEIITRICEIIT